MSSVPPALKETIRGTSSFKYVVAIRPNGNHYLHPVKSETRVAARSPSHPIPSRHLSFDPLVVFLRADADHEVGLVRADSFIAPARPIKNLFFVELVELDVDTVA